MRYLHIWDRLTSLLQSFSISPSKKQRNGNTFYQLGPFYDLKLIILSPAKQLYLATATSLVLKRLFCYTVLGPVCGTVQMFLRKYNIGPC